MRYVGSALAALLLSGCAIKMTAVPISETAREEFGYGTRGIPYYLPRPYLLVTRNVTLPPAAAAPSPSGGTSSTTSPSAAPAASPMAPIDVTATAVPGESPPLQPRYQMQVVYLPDLTRQYALQQEGGFGNVSLVYTLQGGWMFTGLNVQAQTQIPQTIEALTTGVSTLVGTSIEEILTHPIRMAEAGLSGMDPAAVAGDVGPKIWLFEIKTTPDGQMTVDTERPFFEWPTPQATSAPRPSGAGPDPVAPPRPSAPPAQPPSAEPVPPTSPSASPTLPPFPSAAPDGP